MTPRVAIIGCGNANRTDDGVGSHVISLLRKREFDEDIALFDGGTDGMGIVYQARGVSQLIIIDAKSPEESPGAIYEVPGDILEAPPPQSLNLHDFRWDHALFAGRQIYEGAFPSDVSVFLIEAQSLDLGLGLTPLVEKAAMTVAKTIETLVKISNRSSP